MKPDELNVLFKKKITVDNKIPYEGIIDIDLSNDYFKKLYIDISYSNKEIINHIHFLSSSGKDLMTLSYIESRDIYLEGKRQIIIYNIIISILSLIMYLIFIRFISFQDKINKDLEKRIQKELNKRREQEQILIQQSKLASMGEMIGNIAHQWRQPLNALSMIIQNLEFAYKIGDLNDEFMNKNQSKAKLLIEKMSTTIDDFRNFFKPSKMKNHFFINTTILNSLEIINATLQNSNIIIEKEFQEKIPEVFALENELSQVFLILISNAKDALVENKIKKPIIKISTYNQENSVFISVKDNANGIKEEILNKVFEPYFTTKSNNNGTGIGLYMAKTIIEQNMNGKLSVITSNNGSEFIIELKN